MDTANNFSEHFPVKCVMYFNVEYINNSSHLPSTDKEIVDTNLDKISLPHAALLCNDKFCEVHKTQIKGK